MLALPWCLPIGPKSCFYWASKLPRGTFWAGLKSLAAAFDGFSTAQPSAAALEASRLLCHGASLLAPKAVSIGLRNCRVARFGQALKASQQLSTASAPHNPPQQLSKRPACFAMVPPYWPQKLFLLGFCRVAPFGQALKPSKASQQLSTASAPHNPPQQLSQRPACFAMVPPYWPQKLFLVGFATAAWHVLGRPSNPQKLRRSFRRLQHRTTLRSSSHSVLLALPWCLPIGPKSCFYWASKLPRGTFWASLTSFAAAFDGFSTAQPSAAALAASRLLCHGASLLAPKAVSIGLRNCRVARFGKALKASQQLSTASAPHNPPQQLSQRPAGFAMVPPYWPQKLFLLGFAAAWHVLGKPYKLRSSFRRLQHRTTLRSSSRSVPLALPWCLPIGPKSCFYWAFAGAFEGLSTAQPSAAALAASRLLCHGASQKLFLLGFATAAWHVLGRPSNPQKLRRSFRRPQHRTTLRSSSRSVPLALPWCLPIGPKSCFYWASKLPRGTFWAGLKTLKSLAAAFDSPYHS